MALRKVKGRIKQGKKIIAENVPVHLEEMGKVWAGNFGSFPKETFKGADLKVPFILELEDGRRGEINVTFRHSQLIPFEIAFEGISLGGAGD